MSTSVVWSGTNDVIKQLINGNFSYAISIIQHNCKSKPAEQAFRLGVVVGALCDPNGCTQDPDLAVALLTIYSNYR